jgi:D-alanyl-D-alanine dipeptidase
MRRNMSSSRQENEARTYWTEQMEAAASFMEHVLETPTQECGEPLVSLREAASRAGTPVVFSETRLADRMNRRFYLREGLIESFLRAARRFDARGWILKIEDAYRSSAMQRALGRNPRIFSTILDKLIWELNGAAPSPELMFRRLSALVATRPKLGTHMSGSALDISVVERSSGRQVDRGGPYLELSERTPMDSPFVSKAARNNRERISEIMGRCGFVAYPYEFWHYSQGDVFQKILDPKRPDSRYAPVDFDEASGSTSRIEDPLASLHSLVELEGMIRHALEKLEEERSSKPS